MRSPTTQQLALAEGTIAWDDTGGDGPLVVCAPGLGDTRAEYRHLVPLLVAAGHRVVTVDLRGLGESSTGWPSHRPEDVGADLVALLDHLGAAGGSPAVLVGCSLAGASVVWAAAERPDAVAGVVLVCPFVRDLPVAWWQRALLRVMTPGLWTRYLTTLSPTGGPTDLGDHVAAVGRNLREPGRMAATREMLLASKDACEARLDGLDVPALVLMGGADPDFPDPAAEAELVAGRLGGTAVVLDGLGHYPHAEDAPATAPHVVDFVDDVCHASA